MNPVIAIEDREAFDAHLSAYMDRFQPADQVEADTVRRVAIAMWQYDRIVATEAALFSLEFDYHECMIDGRIEVGLDQCQTKLDPIHKMAVCFKEAAGDRAFCFLESKRRKAVAETVVPDEPQAELPRKPNEPTSKPPQPAPVTAIDANRFPNLP